MTILVMLKCEMRRAYIPLRLIT